MKQPLLRLRPLSVSLLLSLVFMFHSVYPLDYSYDEESDLIGQKEPECGISDIEPKVDSRIFGGVEATPHSWPWQVSITFRDYGWTHICGGSVLNSRWVITAAHCVVNGGPADYKIVLGEHNRAKKEGAEQKFKVDEIVIHKNYVFPRNDIALMRLSKDVHFNRYVKPICLPDKDVKDGTRCVTTGWGNTSFTGDERVLNQVYLAVISNKKCKRRVWYDGFVTDNVICAGYSEGRKSILNGDSGGPLSCLPGETRKWTLFGVTSWFTGDCVKRPRPSGFTRVMKYINWIRENTAQKYDN